MFVFLFSFSPFVLFTVPTKSTAQEFVEHQTNAALSSFYGFCLNDQFSLGAVPELAARLGWVEIDDSEMEIFLPNSEAEITSYHGYLAMSPDDPPLPIAIFVGQSLDPEGYTTHCSMFFQDVLPEEFISAFIEDTGALELTSEERLAGDYAFYQVPDFSRELVLIEHQKRARGLRATRLIPDVE